MIPCNDSRLVLPRSKAMQGKTASSRDGSQEFCQTGI